MIVRLVVAVRCRCDGDHKNADSLIGKGGLTGPRMSLGHRPTPVGGTRVALRRRRASNGRSFWVAERGHEALFRSRRSPRGANGGVISRELFKPRRRYSLIYDNFNCTRAPTASTGFCLGSASSIPPQSSTLKQTGVNGRTERHKPKLHQSGGRCPLLHNSPPARCVRAPCRSPSGNLRS